MCLINGHRSACAVSVPAPHSLASQVSFSPTPFLVLVFLRRLKYRDGKYTSFSKTQALSFLSANLHCHSCWLCRSRHCQCPLNSSKQFLLISSSLNHINNRAIKMFRNQFICISKTMGGHTHTPAAHLVTFLPSFMQSTSPVPCASVLHIMKSSL